MTESSIGCSENNTECYLEDLPIEIVEHVMEYLDLLHVYRLAQAKKLFSDIAQSNIVWMSLFRQR